MPTLDKKAYLAAPIVIRLLWIAACLSLLGFYIYGKFAHPVVGDYEEVLGYSMLALAFPVGFVGLAIMGLIVDVTNSPSNMYSMWASMFVLGYIQWFVLLPWLVKTLRLHGRSRRG